MTALVFLSYLGLAGLFLARLIPVWSTHIVGGGEDTRLFLWNAWWIREALQAGHNPFFTPLLFHPFGTSLMTHDMPLWYGLITTLLQTKLSLIAAINTTFVITWALGGFCTYLLAREVSGSRSAAFVAGAAVLSGSYMTARAFENWGQFNLFGIPLFLWLYLRARRFGSSAAYALAGFALAATAACHLYFLIYSALIWMVVVAYDRWPLHIRVGWSWKGWSASSLLWGTLASLAAALVARIHQHPGDIDVGHLHIGMQSPANACLAMWLFLAVWVWTGLFFDRSVGAKPGRSASLTRLKGECLLAAVAVLALTPLIVGTLLAIRSGDYPRQSILWKTHLPGADLLAPFMPSASHRLWGERVTGWYQSHNLEPREEASSIGWVTLAALAFSRLWRVRLRWLLLAISATVLALGVYLNVAGHNLWLPLPFYFLRLMPLLGNVRVPERWMAVGCVAWGVVLAQALTLIAQKKQWRLRPVCAIALLLVLLENWPQLPVCALPPVDAAVLALKGATSRGVLMLPFYAGDSSIGTGDAVPRDGVYFPWDLLLWQMTHGKPITGGYIGRVSRRIIKNYQSDPFVAELIALEEHRDTSRGAISDGCAAACRLQVDHVLVAKGMVDPAVWHFVAQRLPLKEIASGDLTELYEIQCPGPCPSGRLREP